MKIITLCLVVLASTQIAHPLRFKIMRDKQSQHEAEKTCQVMGGKLVDIEDRATELAVQNYISTTLDLPDDERTRIWFWMGRNDIAVEKTYVTADGRYSTNYGWCSGLPQANGNDLDCVSYRMPDLCVGDYYCSYGQYFMCSFDD